MSLRRITRGDPIIDVADMKTHLRVEHDDDDAYIEALTQAATEHLDGYNNILGRALAPQTWELTLDEFPPSEIAIAVLPLVSVESITYDDEDGNEQTVDEADYFVDNAGTEFGWIIPVEDFEWPATLGAANSVRIRFIAGYVDIEQGGSGSASGDMVSGVPTPIQMAIKLLVAHWYENREAVHVGSSPAEMPLAVQALIQPYKRWPV